MIYKKPIFEFSSVFAPYINDYIDLRESLGAKFRAQSGVLRQFDRYCVKQKCNTAFLGERLANGWISLSRGEMDSSRSHRISVLKCFADYFRSVGGEAPWVPHPGYTQRENHYLPYIFTEDEIKRIFEVADNLPKPRGNSMFHFVFPAVLKILYCCGLRVSEALNLLSKDVNLETGFIHVEHSKFENCRHLPISESLKTTLRAYACANGKLIGVNASDFFFPNALGEKYSQRTVYDKFRTVLWQAGIPHRGRGKGPRVHDLRHTFAVRSLHKNLQAGKDMYVSLPVLASYLGHTKVTTTEKYLRLTAELFPEFLETADCVCAPIIPEVTAYED